ncbi:MAG: o-succinylbenzoate synthase [candidate division Zixibacteria bacterium]|nr:o-succinylbenzoate synthase [candidate division Zixibacteria bacterium]
MSIADFEIYRYRLPLKKPLRLSNQTIFDRQGLIIRLEDKNRHVGWGEIAPFPGLHNENLSAAEAQTVFLQKKMAGFTLPENLEAFPGVFEERLGKFALRPSVRCGLETALLNLMADRRHQPLCSLLSAFPRKTVSLNGLVAENSANLSGQIQALVEEGYRAIKLKVGRQSLEEDIALVKTARELSPSSVTIRLDANRAWDLPRAVAFGKALADCQIEYIEEPLQELPDLEKFYDQSGLPLALDESLTHISPHFFPTISVCDDPRRLWPRP